MNTPNNDPLAFVAWLRKEADGFANTFHVSTILCWVFVAVWALGHLCLGFAPLPARALSSCAYWTLGYFVFRAVACLIDYAIFAVAHAFMAVANTYLLAAAEAIAVNAETTPSADTRSPASTVAYMREFLARRPDVDPKPAA